MLIRFIMVMTPLVFLINGISKGDWLESLLFAVSVAVGLTPEMLPMIVTANLAKGAVAMARRKAIVKRLNAIQNFGAMDILCTDKTGTLTQNKVILETPPRYPRQRGLQVLEFAWLNSFHQTGLEKPSRRCRAGICAATRWCVARLSGTTGKSTKSRSISCAAACRSWCATATIKTSWSAKAPSRRCCRFALSADDNGAAPGGAVPFTTEMRKRSAPSHARAKRGRASRALPSPISGCRPRTGPTPSPTKKTLSSPAMSRFSIRPRRQRVKAIAALREHGIAIKIITGDNEVVTRKICNEVGLAIEHALLGRDVEELSDAAARRSGRAHHDFRQDVALAEIARDPRVAKQRPYRRLSRRRHQRRGGAAKMPTSAFRSIPPSISPRNPPTSSCWKRACWCSKRPCIEGRKTFANIIKYIKMTASSNFGNVFSVLIASIFLPFLPMLPIQLLVQNLLYDISQVSIPWDDVDTGLSEATAQMGCRRYRPLHGVHRSHQFDFRHRDLSRDVVCVRARTRVEKQSLFQSGWFVVGLLTQTLIVHMIRTQHIPFIQSRAATPVILIDGFDHGHRHYLPFSSLGEHLGMVPLPLSYFPWLAAMLLSYCVLTQLVKQLYIRRFGQWL